MSRKTLDDDEKNAVCVRYVQTGSLRAVGCRVRNKCDASKAVMG